MHAETSDPNAEKLSNHARVKSDEVSARLYTHRKPRKHRTEMQLVEKAFSLLPAGSVKSVLDAPCGVGRISVWLAQQGCQVTGVDLGEAAVELSRAALDEQGLTADIKVQNIMAMEFGDREFDCSICFRLLHHFEEADAKERLIRELCRVTSRYVIISYFSPVSVTSLRRRFRNLLSGKPVKQYPDSLSALQASFNKSDFQLYGQVKRSKLLHSLQLAIFERHL